jgi:flagellar biosynthesis/type III secretory pathway chaperone
MPSCGRPSFGVWPMRRAEGGGGCVLPVRLPGPVYITASEVSKGASVAEPNSVKPLPPIWRRRRWLLSAGGALLFVAAVLWLLSVPPGGFWGWTGIDGKTAWDLAELVVVPLALAFVAFYLSWQQKKFELEQARADREAEQERGRADREAEQERARAERENERQIARDREEDAALNMYYDRMSELLLNHSLRDSDETAEERSIARARTLTILRRLSPERKGALVQFLFEAGLILAQKTVVSLRGADLHKAELAWTNLEGADLRGAILTEAKLTSTRLEGADLRETVLSKASLVGAKLRGADLRQAYLENADLQGAYLEKADLQEAILVEANLILAHLRETNFQGAFLPRADLRLAYLEGADLRKAGYNNETQWPTGYVPPSDALNVDVVRTTDSAAQSDGTDSLAQPIAAPVEPNKATSESTPKG